MAREAWTKRKISEMKGPHETYKDGYNLVFWAGGITVLIVAGFKLTRRISWMVGASWHRENEWGPAPIPLMSTTDRRYTDADVANGENDYWSRPRGTGQSFLRDPPSSRAEAVARGLKVDVASRFATDTRPFADKISDLYNEVGSTSDVWSNYFIKRIAKKWEEEKTLLDQERKVFEAALVGDYDARNKLLENLRCDLKLGKDIMGKLKFAESRGHESVAGLHEAIRFVAEKEKFENFSEQEILLIHTVIFGEASQFNVYKYVEKVFADKEVALQDVEQNHLLKYGWKLDGSFPKQVWDQYDVDPETFEKNFMDGLKKR